MRILVVQEAAAHPAAREFREALCLKRALARLGVEAWVWGPGFAMSAVPFEDLARHADVILLLENWDRRGWVPDLGRFRALRVFWTIDSHCVLGAHVALARRQKIQLLLSATEGYLPHYRARGRRCAWFPNAYPADLIRPLRSVRKRHDVGFCGNVLDRGPWIERLVAEFGLRVLSFHGAAGPDASAIGKGMVRAVNSFRLHWNRNLADDINYRTFETLGCGTLLLTNYTPGLEKLFDPGRHLALYQDWDDLRRTVRRLLDDPEERAEIAAAGHAHARAHHTYDVRARQLLDLVRRM